MNNTFFSASIAFLMVLGWSTPTWASDGSGTREIDYAAFERFGDISIADIAVPSVVEVRLPDQVRIGQPMAVVDKGTGEPVPIIVRNEVNTVDLPFMTGDSFGSAEASFLTDGKYDRYASYEVDGRNRSTVTLEFRSTKPVSISSLTFILDEHVALPHTVSVRSESSSGEKVLLAERTMDSRMVSFPKTIASVFRVTLAYSQPLRISEVVPEFGVESVTKIRKNSVRFLAIPKVSYQLYYDADRYVAIRTGEAPDLSSDEGVIPGVLSQSDNPKYRKSDQDKDGIPDERDNCVLAANADQKDVDRNGRGDQCDDFDRDGVANAEDNCRDQPNRDQADSDMDAKGDECDNEEGRILQAQRWLPSAMIVAVLLVVGGLLFMTMRRKR
jgi:hypothetical protein